MKLRLRQRLQHVLSPHVLATLVLAACLGATAALWQGARSDAEHEARNDFAIRVRELVNHLDLRMQTYAQVLYGVQGLFVSSDQVSAAEFHTYLDGQHLQQHFPGIQGVGYMARLVPQQLDAHVAQLRRSGMVGYRVHPAGARDWYAAITYLEPSTGSNARAIGYDPASDPVRRATLEQARDTGQPALSARIRLVQEHEQEAPVQAGFLMVLPLYRHGEPTGTLAERRAAIRGWVYAPFRLQDLMTGLGGLHAAGLDVEIYDGSTVSAATRMYDSQPDGMARSHSSAQQFAIGGRVWTLQIGAIPSGAAATSKATLIGLTGTLFSVVLAALTFQLAHSRVRARAAQRYAETLASELGEREQVLLALASDEQRSQATLRSILDSTMDGILVADLQGGILNVNRRLRELWHLPDHLDWQSDGAALLAHMAQHLRLPVQAPLLTPAASGLPGWPAGGELALLQLRDGRVIEQHSRSLQLGSMAARLYSFRDITERTRASQREQTRRQVLELLSTGAPLQTILESVVRGVETGNEEMLCSVLLREGDEQHLRVGAAPSLPVAFSAAVHAQALHDMSGPCSQAVQQGRRVIIADIAALSASAGGADYRSQALQAGLRSCWAEPIFGASGKVLGAFAIYHREARLPSMAHITLIEQAAQLAGIAIEQASAALALRVGEARFRSLYDHAPVALWEQDWSAVRLALEQLDLSGIDDLASYLQANPAQLDYLAGLVRIVDVNAAGLAQVAARADRQDLAQLTLAQIFDSSAMPNFALALAALARGQHIFSCEGSFRRLDGVARRNELTLLVMPGHHHSLDFLIVSTLDTTERRRMHDELQLLATTDALTGLPNRREFMRRLEEEQSRVQRAPQQGACVLLLDVDHFKRINDEYGHAAGDQVLQQLADRMNAGRRKIDMLGRIGGEEFAILLPATTPAAAALTAERLRAWVAEAPMHLPDGVALEVTVSIGLAPLDPADAEGAHALSRADQALYAAKRAGRNRVLTAPL
jgi:diguanylate cyclase (GGDEF)-like protein